MFQKLKRKILGDFFREEVNAMNSRLLTVEENMRNINAFIERINDNLDALNVKMRGLEKKVQRKNQLEGEKEIHVSVSKENENNYESIDYFDFENHFRGNRTFIKDSQKQYLPYFLGKKNVLDLGCGRGEFLELLKENNIPAIGVDFYEEFTEYCKERQLSAVCGDAIEYLEQCQEPIGGIFAGQLIEHLTPEQIQRICDLAWEKMEAGSYLIMETPNPTSLAIYTNSFYMDPSHVKPVHPLTLRYYLEKSGFRDIKIIYTETSKPDMCIPKINISDVDGIEEFNSSMQKVSEILFGSQDYAAVAKK